MEGGVNDYIETGYDAESNDLFTISFWVKTAPASLVADQTIIATQAATAGEDEKIVFEWNSGGACSAGQVQFVVADTDSPFGDGVCTTSSLSNTTWAHVVGTYNGAGSISVYFNGTLQDSATVTSESAGIKNLSGYPLFAGARNLQGSSAEFFNGSIDNLRIYPRVLSESQILAEYNSGISRYNLIDAQ